VNNLLNIILNSLGFQLWKC